jgi:hypothetical protein
MIRKLLTAAALAALMIPATAAVADDEPMLMFVQTANDFDADPDSGSLRLIGVSPQTLYFSDRPVRLAGHLTMADYLKTWNEGGDDFNADPPNATLSVYNANADDNTLVVIEIDDPVVDGADLIYKYSLIEGTMPESGGATAIFIDMIGLGGGVGVGFHGVGVGARGPGVL